MEEDQRCCGSGTCLINAEGVCWCGQQWDGEKMSAPAPLGESHSATANLPSNLFQKS
jgi:hypothetical protein